MSDSVANSMKLVEETVIPTGRGHALVVPKGQVLRIFLVEDTQVGDCVFYNADDHREYWHCGQSWGINATLGTGNARRFKYFYSKPPRENLMLTVVQDTVGNHWGNMSGRCSRMLYERWGYGAHRSCQQNLEEALEPFRISPDEVYDVFNVFMNAGMDGDGNFTIETTTAKKGDFIDLRAEMNILAGISACPDDKMPTNGGSCKPLGLKVFAPE